jgi:hypothetical protein
VTPHGGFPPNSGSYGGEPPPSHHGRDSRSSYHEHGHSHGRGHHQQSHQSQHHSHRQPQRHHSGEGSSSGGFHSGNGPPVLVNNTGKVWIPAQPNSRPIGSTFDETDSFGPYLPPRASMPGVRHRPSISRFVDFQTVRHIGTHISETAEWDEVQDDPVFFPVAAGEDLIPLDALKELLHEQIPWGWDRPTMSTYSGSPEPESRGSPERYRDDQSEELDIADGSPKDYKESRSRQDVHSSRERDDGIRRASRDGYVQEREKSFEKERQLERERESSWEKEREIARAREQERKRERDSEENREREREHEREQARRREREFERERQREAEKEWERERERERERDKRRESENADEQSPNEAARKFSWLSRHKSDQSDANIADSSRSQNDNGTSSDGKESQEIRELAKPVRKISLREYAKNKKTGNIQDTSSPVKAQKSIEIKTEPTGHRAQSSVDTTASSIGLTEDTPLTSAVSHVTDTTNTSPRVETEEKKTDPDEKQAEPEVIEDTKSKTNVKPEPAGNSNLDTSVKDQTDVDMTDGVATRSSSRRNRTVSRTPAEPASATAEVDTTSNSASFDVTPMNPSKKRALSPPPRMSTRSRTRAKVNPGDDGAEVESGRSSKKVCK